MQCFWYIIFWNDHLRQNGLTGMQSILQLAKPRWIHDNVYISFFVLDLEIFWGKSILAEWFNQQAQGIWQHSSCFFSESSATCPEADASEGQSSFCATCEGQSSFFRFLTNKNTFDFLGYSLELILEHEICWMGGFFDGRMDGFFGWMDGCFDGWMDVLMDGWMDGWMFFC